MLESARVISAIEEKRKAKSPGQAVLVGISGIDGSGKGYVTAELEKKLRAAGWSIAAIGADDWLNLPDVCINRQNPGEHFYQHALRLDEMFNELVVPLQQQRKIDVVADCGDARATALRKH